MVLGVSLNFRYTRKSLSIRTSLYIHIYMYVIYTVVSKNIEKLTDSTIFAGFYQHLFEDRYIDIHIGTYIYIYIYIYICTYTHTYIYIHITHMEAMC